MSLTAGSQLGPYEIQPARDAGPSTSVSEA